MESFVFWLNKTQKILTQKRVGDGYELLVMNATDPDYPEYYKITMTKEYL